MSKRKTGGHLSPLERASRTLATKFAVRRDRDVLFIGSDSLLASKRGVKHLRLRFWTGAQKEHREAVVKALDKARIQYEVGPEFDLEHKGRRLSPKPALVLLGATGEETIGTFERTPHVRSCLLCRELLDQAATGDLEYQQKVYAVVTGHIKENPKPEAPACQYAGCVHHEDIGRELARAMIRLSKDGEPWKDQRGVTVSTIALVASGDDHPAGWNFRPQDAESRHFKELPRDEAGTVYIRLAPRRVTAHVWIEPQYATKQENLDDPATIEEIIETWGKKVPALREWAMKKYADLKGLAEMDLDVERPKK